MGSDTAPGGINDMTAAYTLEHGNRTRNTDKESGKKPHQIFQTKITSINSRDITKWIRNMDMEFTTGQMVVYTKAIGLMENSMDKENTFYKMVKSKLESGLMVRGQNGFMKTMIPLLGAMIKVLEILHL